MGNKQAPQKATFDPRHEVSGPYVGLLVTGIIGALFELVVFISIILDVGVKSFYKYGPSWIYEDYVENIFEGAFGLFFTSIGLVVSAFIIYAAMKMKDLNQWGLCMAASILAMIPCVSPCCFIGLPMGIWSLVVLTKPEVRSAFQQG